MQRTYEIKPGVRSFRTDKSQLYLVSRRISREIPGTFGSRAFAERIAGSSAVWISLLYRPEIIGRERSWHNMRDSDVKSKAEYLANQFSRERDITEQSLSALTFIALAGASGLIKQPIHNHAIDLITESISLLPRQAGYNPELHELNRGALNAHLDRISAQNQSISA